VHLHDKIIAVVALLLEKLCDTLGLDWYFSNTWVASEFDETVDVVTVAASERGCPGQADERDFGVWEMRTDGSQSRYGQEQVAEIQCPEDGDATDREVAAGWVNGDWTTMWGWANARVAPTGVLGVGG
jgi:hypothetical protein